MNELVESANWKETCNSNSEINFLGVRCLALRRVKDEAKKTKRTELHRQQVDHAYSSPGGPSWHVQFRIWAGALAFHPRRRQHKRTQHPVTGTLCNFDRPTESVFQATFGCNCAVQAFSI